MPAPDTGERTTESIEELARAYAAVHGEDAVRRALKLSPMLSLVRDAGDFHIDTAERAAGTDGVVGALVLALPRKANQPTEVSFVGGKPEFVLTV